MLVINDDAERGIKLASDYIDILSEVIKEQDIHTVQFTRKNIGGCKKTNANFF